MKKYLILISGLTVFCASLAANASCNGDQVILCHQIYPESVYQLNSNYNFVTKELTYSKQDSANNNSSVIENSNNKCDLSKADTGGSSMFFGGKMSCSTNFNFDVYGQDYDLGNDPFLLGAEKLVENQGRQEILGVVSSKSKPSTKLIMACTKYTQCH